MQVEVSEVDLWLTKTKERLNTTSALLKLLRGRGYNPEQFMITGVYGNRRLNWDYDDENDYVLVTEPEKE